MPSIVILIKYDWSDWSEGAGVIPKALRDRAHLQPGDEIDFELREQEIVLVARRSPARLGGRFSKTGWLCVCSRIGRASHGERLSGFLGGSRLARR